MEFCKLRSKALEKVNYEKVADMLLKKENIEDYMGEAWKHIQGLEIKWNMSGSIEGKECPQSKLAGIIKSLSIKKSVFCFLLSKDIHPTTAAQIARMGKTQRNLAKCRKCG